MTQGLRLSQRLTQTLVLAPQLQQSLALLQAPMLELKALVERELQQNPVLEEVSPAEADSPEKLDADDDKIAATADPAEPPTDVSFDSTFEERSPESGDDFQTEFERLAQMDQEWRDHLAQTNLATRPSVEDEEKRQFRFDSLVADPSLQEALLEQVRDAEIAEADYPVAEAIIGNIDDHGYLKASLEEIAQATGRSVEQVQPVLQIVQTFEPPGVAARDLRECLLLQLQRAEQTESLEYRIIRDHMEALSRRRIPELARATETSIEDVQSALARIAQLEPRPGREFSSEEAHYVLPEVFVQRLGDDFVVTTNNDQVPHLRISNTYKDLMSRSAVDPASLAAAFAEAPKAQRTLANEAAEAMRQGKDIPALGHLRQLAEQRELTPDGRRAVQVAMAQLQEKAAFIEARDFIRDKIRAGKFFIKSLHQRQQTIANIAHEIVARQREFLEKGVAHLKPLTMATVAEAVGVHETTVSRAVSGKYMQTPQGVFEMKYFFTSGIQTQDGAGLSNTSVKDMIAEIFKAESPTQPLSDREVVQMLKEKGIVIARRTVAKYRIELNILPSNLRKVY
ncbi:MAG TPA: RNA polymerase sigma-54 factor [Verrucomicrobiota bacterium]|jgi:RNA polymerase sigma-54 factor|nr:MAG: RNA polymerase sigma-54 factor [Verrucomicrobia bacterium ADurb.Bin118]HPY30480.1 RNA polymerase sigma-54 factor [Verrucomicrobiota bacterium]HQB15380.1 RNA polymerase sigma-54 factor [Verrucomicrobiota bacterium]